MQELTANEQAIMSFLQSDALSCGKIYHFDPGWVAKECDLYDLEFRTAARDAAERL